MTPHPEHPEHTYIYDLELDTWDSETIILKRETWNVPGPTNEEIAYYSLRDLNRAGERNVMVTPCRALTTLCTCWGGLVQNLRALW